MDKTGTLTEGKPAVAKVVALNGHTERLPGGLGHWRHRVSIRLPVLSRVREQSRLEPRTGPRFHLIPGKRRDCAIGRTVV